MQHQEKQGTQWELVVAKLRRLSGREVCKILSQHGFLEVRQKGSHIQMRKR